MNKKIIEFSKLILALVIMSYFIGLFYGIHVIEELIKTGNFVYIATALCGFFTYIGGPVAAAIAFYSNKAKAENVEKIKNSNIGKVIKDGFKLPID